MKLRCHPNVIDSFDEEIEENLLNYELRGYISLPIIKALFYVYSWEYVEKTLKHTFVKESVFEKLFKLFPYKQFMWDDMYESAILFYSFLSTQVDMRALDTDSFVKYIPGTGVNKQFTEEYFVDASLYESYKNNVLDIPKDFLKLNFSMSKDIVQEQANMTHYGQVINTASKVDLLRPDLPYKLITHELRVKVQKEEKSKETLVIIQDCTVSMRNYVNELLMTKVFILNKAFKNNLTVHWIRFNKVIESEVYFNKATYLGDSKTLGYNGDELDLKKALRGTKYIDKDLIIITDGTDNFNSDLNVGSKSLNVISFTDNLIIRNKLANYGRFFKVE